MRLQVSRLCKLLVAEFTAEFPDTRVLHHMQLEGTFLVERPVTDVTFERSLPRVHTGMSH